MSTDNCSNVRIKCSAQNDHHPPSHKLKDVNATNAQLQQWRCDPAWPTQFWCDVCSRRYQWCVFCTPSLARCSTCCSLSASVKVGGDHFMHFF